MRSSMKSADLRAIFYPARMNRVHFTIILSLVLIVLTATVVAAVMLDMNLSAGLPKSVWLLVVIPLLVISAIILLLAGISRLHDIGLSGWLLPVAACTVIIPYVGKFIPLLLCIIPGTTAANKFGNIASTASKKATILAVILFLATLALLYCNPIG